MAEIYIIARSDKQNKDYNCQILTSEWESLIIESINGL